MKDNLVGKILIIVGMCMIFYSAFCKKDCSTTYMKSAEVIQVRDNIVYLEDTSGNIWTVEDDTLKLYGRYIVTFDSMDTEDITDDEIVEVN